MSYDERPRGPEMTSAPRPILYVDDDRANLVVFQAAFGDELEVLTASSGAEALEVLRRTPAIALLLTDQRMPGMTGAQLAEAVRREHPDVIRYLITAYSDLGAAIDAINLGQVHRYLKKPWDPVEMRVQLREGLEVYELRRRLRELEARLREVERVYALGVIAGSVVHELRNPMSVVVGFVDLARTQLDRLADVAGARGGEAVEEIRSALAGAWDGIHRMAEIAKGVELTTRRQIGTTRADLGEVVGLTLQLVRNELRLRAQTQVELPAGLNVTISPTQLGQVALNLLLNAVQAIPAAPDTSRIAIVARRDGDRARLEVADNGPGVPEPLKAKIFDPFFTTKDDGGTGLGLAISRAIVSQAGGELRIEDTPGGGATFVVDLPIADT